MVVTQGGAGCVVEIWAHSMRLRESVACLCRRLANSIVPWVNVRALMSSRLIVLDKCPGVRPVGVGETLRRIVGKVICLVTRLDAEKVCGATQLCAGVVAGIEGAVHALSELFDDFGNDGWGVLMIDAKKCV